MKKIFTCFVVFLLVFSNVPVYSDDSLSNETISTFTSEESSIVTEEKTESTSGFIQESSFFDMEESTVNSHVTSSSTFIETDSTVENIHEESSEMNSSTLNSVEEKSSEKEDVDPYFPLEPNTNDMDGDKVRPGEILLPNYELFYRKSSKINQEIINNVNKGIFKRAKIVEDWRTYSMFPYKSLDGGTQNIPQGIVIHETANPNSSIYGEISYMDRNWRNAFVHAFVDKDNIIEIHDPSYGAWGAGRIANQYFMHVELVEHVGNRTAFMQSILNDAHYVASKLYQFGLVPSRPTKNKNDISGTIWSHHEVSSYLGGTNHTDPTGYFNQFSYSMEEFYELIVYEFQQLDKGHPLIEYAEINTIDYSKQRFNVEIKASAKTGVQKVLVPVWTASHQEDIKWLEAKLNKDGTYTVQVDGKGYRNPEKGYKVHAYVTGNNGNQTSTDVGTILLDNDPPVIEEVKVSSINYKENSFEVTIKASSKSGIKTVDVPVWTTEMQTDIKWLKATLNKDGNYTLKIDGSEFKQKNGPFQIHVYVTSNNEKVSATNIDSVILDNLPPEIISVKYENINHYTGSFDVIINAKVKSGIKKIQLPVWTKQNQSDLFWYQAEKDGNGHYRATIQTKNHSFSKDPYQIHLYAESHSNQTTQIPLSPIIIKENITKISHSIDNVKNEDEKYLLTTKFNVESKVDKVKYAVWSNENQSDLTWYDAKYNKSNHIWEYELNIRESNYKNLGKYTVHSYVYLPSGEVRSYNTKGFEIQGAKVQLINKKVDDTGNVEIKVESKSGVERIEVPVWSEKDQSDLHWYNATKIDENKYNFKFNYNNHKLNYGKFNIHSYIYHKNGTRTEVNLNELDVSPIRVEAYTQLKDSTGTENKYSLSIKLSDNRYVKEVEVPVWGEANGQNDIIWYKAKYNSKINEWQLDIPISNHKEIGKYFVEVYARLKNDKLMYLKSEKMEISPIDYTIDVDKSEINKGKFDIQLVINTKSRVNKVEFPIWSEEDQSNIHWYAANKIKGNEYQVEVDYKNHYFKNGEYMIHMYIYLDNGIVQSFPIENILVRDKLSSDSSINSNFIKNISKDAQKISTKNGLYASVTLAQASLESGYGTSKLSQEANNYFGIKFKINEDEGKYDCYYIESLEYDSMLKEWITVKSPFIKYSNSKESLVNYAYKFKNGVSWDSKYYNGAWKVNAPTYRNATQALQGKYATDPNYAKKLNSIIDTWRLDQFD